MIPRFIKSAGIIFGILLCATLSLVDEAAAREDSSSGAGDLSAVLRCGGADNSGPFVQAEGRVITFNGQPLPLAGYTMYPIHAHWHDATFNNYIDTIMTMAQHAGQNLIRPTDEWTKKDSNRDYSDPVVWQHLDHLVCEAGARGLFVIMDLSAYKWLLTAHGADPMKADLWQDFLKAAGHHYSETRSIVEYSIVGEPAFPKTQSEMDNLTAYYRQLTDTLYAADHNHLIAAGGFNHMNSGVKNWWQSIFALPHNDVGNFKVYSQNDINLMPAIAAVAVAMNKPLILEETGLPQKLGDSMWSGEDYNNLKMSRRDYLNLIYKRSHDLGVSAVVVWNVACQAGPDHYDIYPGTPGAWEAMKMNGAITPLAGQGTCPY